MADDNVNGGGAGSGEAGGEGGAGGEGTGGEGGEGGQGGKTTTTGGAGGEGQGGNGSGGEKGGAAASGAGAGEGGDKNKGEGKQGSQGTEGKREIPEKYDLKLPEKSLLKEDAIQSVADFAKANKLTSEEAQALLERESAQEADRQEKQKEEMNKAKEGWLAEAKADKEIGGEKFKENSELAYNVFSKYGNEEVQKFLDDTGFGDNKHVIRMFAKIGRDMQDAKFVPGGTASGEKKSTAKVLFGKD